MPALTGIFLVVASVFLFAWSILVFRDPAGPAWRQTSLVLELLACAIVSIFSFGLALQLQFAVQFEGPTAGIASISVIALTAVIFWAVWRVMGITEKVSKFDACKAAKQSSAAEGLQHKQA